MTTYIVTLEIRTPWYKKLLRFFKIMKERDEFALTLSTDCFMEENILTQPECRDLLILKKI